jgi:hypothetical protein
MADLWKFNSDIGHDRADLTGMKVEAVDGDVGKVEDVIDSPLGRALVVDTGPLVFSRKVLLPAGLVTAIDVDDERIKVNRTKDEIKQAPELDTSLLQDPEYQESLTRHYGTTRSGV